jgi:hypothetical protein
LQITHHGAIALAISMPGVDGAPDWHRYETLIWDCGEKLRNCLKKRKKGKNSVALHRMLATIVNEPQFGKGRQPFIELLARHAGESFYTHIVSSLDDHDIFGHAVSALCIAKIGGADRQVQAILDQNPASWIKREAKQYLKVYGEKQ